MVDIEGNRRRLLTILWNVPELTAAIPADPVEEVAQIWVPEEIQESRLVILFLNSSQDLSCLSIVVDQIEQIWVIGLGKGLESTKY